MRAGAGCPRPLRGTGVMREGRGGRELKGGTQFENLKAYDPFAEAEGQEGFEAGKGAFVHIREAGLALAVWDAHRWGQAFSNAVAGRR